MKVKTFQVVGANNPDNSAVVWIYSSGAGTVTLPAANTSANRVYAIINQQLSSVSISTYKSIAIGTSTTLGANTSLWLVSDGSGWYQIK